MNIIETDSFAVAKIKQLWSIFTFHVSRYFKEAYQIVFSRNFLDPKLRDLTMEHDALFNLFDDLERELNNDIRHENRILWKETVKKELEGLRETLETHFANEERSIFQNILQTPLGFAEEVKQLVQTHYEVQHKLNMLLDDWNQKDYSRNELFDSLSKEIKDFERELLDHEKAEAELWESYLERKRSQESQTK